MRSLLLTAALTLGVAAPTLAQPAVAVLPDGAWVTPFVAYPLEGGDALFTGEYTVVRQDGLLREIQAYRDLQGKVVHRVESLYDERNRRPLFYDSHDFVNGEAVSAHIQPGGVDYEKRDESGRVVSSGHEDRSQPTYLWPNLTRLVDENWDNGITGKDLFVDLFFSSLGTAVTVQVAAEGKATVDGAPAEQFRVMPRNSLIKLFVKPMRLVFSADKTHRLLIYEGRSVVSDRNHKNLDLRIVFGSRRAG